MLNPDFFWVYKCKLRQLLKTEHADKRGLQVTSRIGDNDNILVKTVPNVRLYQYLKGHYLYQSIAKEQQTQGCLSRVRLHYAVQPNNNFIIDIGNIFPTARRNIFMSLARQPLVSSVSSVIYDGQPNSLG